ncbi:MAG: FkbM family methyltransferase [Chlorobiaceae bacterium]|nr:FkbM family methyltransferase [Chlorobiaceae bacterium]NTW75015.1 FkbM family methyltransferase [Chlorobiaceae bacterium]
MSSDASTAVRRSFEQLLNTTKRRFRQMTGHEVRAEVELECVTMEIGGWSFSPIGLGDSSVVFSLGVANDIRFDKGVIERFSCQVHAFDPTPRWVEWIRTQETPPQFHFHPFAIAGNDGTLRMFPRIPKKGKRSSSMLTLVDEGAGSDIAIEAPVRRVPTIMTELGTDRIDILKMDIEAAEYEVIDDLLDSGVLAYQILVEFHHRFKSVPTEKTKSVIKKLRAAGYRIFHISEKYREFSFIHEPTFRKHLP